MLWLTAQILIKNERMTLKHVITVTNMHRNMNIQILAQFQVFREQSGIKLF